MTAQDAEAQLKALLFGRKGSTPSSSGTGSPAVASPLRKLPHTPLLINGQLINNRNTKAKKTFFIWFLAIFILM